MQTQDRVVIYKRVLKTKSEKESGFDLRFYGNENAKLTPSLFKTEAGRDAKCGKERGRLASWVPAMTWKKKHKEDEHE